MIQTTLLFFGQPTANINGRQKEAEQTIKGRETRARIAHWQARTKSLASSEAKTLGGPNPKRKVGE